MAYAVLSSRNDQKRSNNKGFTKNYPQNRSNNFSNFTQNPSFNAENHNVPRRQKPHGSSKTVMNVEDYAYCREFISFDLASLSRNKLNELKNRLIKELKCVRGILSRIETHELGKKRKRENVGVSVREAKRRGVVESPLSKGLKKCREALVKLMNLKSAVAFNQPVDVEVLQLPDYNLIIKNPMDLGTIKGKLERGCYRTLEAFAADVRLTFENAMVYNPKGSKVYVAAEKLVVRFEQLFGAVSKSYEAQCPSVKQCKPVAKGLNDKSGRKENAVLKLGGLRKREMRVDEKEELVEQLQEMPPEVAARMVHMLRGRNPGLMMEGDEIELDIEALDVETLWELEGFVAKYKKASKMSDAEQVENPGSVLDPKKHSPMIVLGHYNVEMNKEGGEVEEDVDIGEEILVGNFPSVEIEKDVAAPNNSGSSSSSSSSDSDSSSSSDSDSLS